MPAKKALRWKSKAPGAKGGDGGATPASSVTRSPGRISWVPRSALWGFPDYTTAEVRPDGLYTYARLRFGRGDMGVNAARLQAWAQALTQG